MAKANNDGVKRSSAEVPLCAFIILLLTHCYAVLAILDRRVYVDEDVRKNYKIEDFLWSGSGDGENETELTATPEQTTWERTTTVFHTTTIISTSTVFYNSLSTVISDTSIGPVAVNCSTNVGSSSSSSSSGGGGCFITPTPTVNLAPNTANIAPWPPPPPQPPPDYSSFADIPDQRYWLITVLKTTNATNAQFVPFELEEHLAKLYKIAFHRHQERHLGLRIAGANASGDKVRDHRSTLHSQYLPEWRPRKRRDHPQQHQHQRRRRDTVTVHIHNVSNNDVLNILYSVRVSGLPVLAATAARDMKLVSDAEVVAELGYPVLTKAEPYLKSPPTIREDPSLNEDYVIVLVSSVCAAAFFSVLLFYVVLTLKKRLKARSTRRPPTPAKTPKKGQLVVAAAATAAAAATKKTRPTMNDDDGVDNAAFVSAETDGSSIGERSQTRRKSTPDTNGKAVAVAAAAADSQYYSRLPSDRAASPNSFLSMPSVRNFPTTPLPEPLTNLLNTSSPPTYERDRTRTTAEEDRMKLSRHGSLGGEDPGVVGPMVWHVHRHRAKKAGTAAAGAYRNDERSSPDSDVDMGQMRKRLNRLLDDALSLHGNRRSSNNNDYNDDYDDDDHVEGRVTRFKGEDGATYSFEQTEIRNVQRRSQSAVTRDLVREAFTVPPPPLPLPRPRTYAGSDVARKPLAAPKSATRPQTPCDGAWTTASTGVGTPTRPLHSRPLSAGPFHRPIVCPEFILTDAQLLPSDPIVPVISAIKQELNKIPEYKRQPLDRRLSSGGVLKSKLSSASSASSSHWSDDAARH